jgi:hypothetical protein
LLTHFSKESVEAFKSWKKHDDQQETFCEIDGKASFIICFGLRIRQPSISEIKKNKKISYFQFGRTVFFRTDHKFPRGSFFPLVV